MQDETTDQEPDGASGGGGENPALREALRRARVEAAERADVVIDLRAAETGRLALLRDELAPVFADIPNEIDLFDIGLVGGERPRLFVDMVAFVEMGRDRRTYRFLRDGRNGRTLIVETDQLKPMVAAVTAYVARRLVERERLLADEDKLAQAAAFAPAQDAAPVVQTKAQGEPGVIARAPTAQPVPKKSGWLKALAVLFAFVVGGGVGAAVIVALMVAAAKGLLPGVG